MLIGEFEHSIDDKGRIAIPAKFRSYFAAGIVVTRGLDRCLFVFSQQEWEELASRIAQLPLTQREARDLARWIFSGATECQLDRQGRIVLPAFLRQYALANSEVSLIGVNTRLEIWDREAWQQAKLKAEEDGERIAEHLANLGV
ncbi:MAG: division/cell wall cluster transcriptional repressor MraZ [Chloroflexi bacterium]|nr:division/cell wall cluster transcriptional repressor MraZ [Chloroflexota bacterium]